MAAQSLKDLASIQAASRPQRIVFEHLHLSPLKVRLYQPLVINSSQLISGTFDMTNATTQAGKIRHISLSFPYHQVAILYTNINS